ncbi:hypothetical protein PHOSAC3_121108 [Mesotoga infera]|nr:hypothetical protein PHOSAC3_121108 [Mesotoga infera]
MVARSCWLWRYNCKIDTDRLFVRADIIPPFFKAIDGVIREKHPVSASVLKSANSQCVAYSKDKTYSSWIDFRIPERV